MNFVRVWVLVLMASTAEAGGTFGLGGPGAEYAGDAAVDAQGNVYVVGGFSGTVDFDPADGTAKDQLVTIAGSGIQGPDTGMWLTWPSSGATVVAWLMIFLINASRSSANCASPCKAVSDTRSK